MKGGKFHVFVLLKMDSEWSTSKSDLAV